MVDISVCISVHNTATYLPRCLDSVCAQTLMNLEIVIVNNGSTDNSEDIMHDYEIKHPERKFVIVAQEDRGLAQGRQTGVNNASGKYISFLDADDYVTPECYEKMLNNAQETGADIVEMQTRRGDEIISSPLIGVQDAHVVLKRYFEGEQSTKMLWLKLYKHELFERSVFPNIYVNNEDGFAWPCLLYSAKQISFLKETLHCYSIDNKNAVMISLFTNRAMSEKLKHNRKRILYIIPHVVDFIGRKNIDNEFQPSFNTLVNSILIKYLTVDVPNFPFTERIDDIIRIIGFNNYKEIKAFIYNNLKGDTRIDIMVKKYGIRNLYRINKIRGIIKSYILN